MLSAHFFGDEWSKFEVVEANDSGHTAHLKEKCKTEIYMVVCMHMQLNLLF